RLYRDGVGVEQDPERAYVWFNRAAAMHHGDAARERDGIGRKLSPDQLERAQRRSEEPADEFGPAVRPEPDDETKRD
ncbi:MAG TPA: sel1 repeat family protein, partial [Rhodocyclaceae bacterium]|nr:sel1 repeat family protein [Rhodocyclaceae bacterium]